MSQNTKKVVSGIIDAVRSQGDKALINYTKKFDNIVFTAKDLIISRAECKKSLRRVNPEILKAIKTAYKNIYSYNIKQKNNIKNLVINNKGCSIKEIITPVDRAGVYIPGGRFPYPSSALMNIIPAKVAGVKEIIVVTPKRNLTDVVRAALYIAGADKVVQIGGAQAVAALAYGTKTVPKVDIIVGPGNKYVTEAKRQVFGDVGIDMIAGPSEVVVWADSSANAECVAEDLFAQAEHDPDARAALVTNSKVLADKVKQITRGKYKKQINVVLVSSDKQSIDFINSKAPEHLEIIVKNAKNKLKYIKNAGAVFLGSHTPVAMGDYLIGPSHTLPTGGNARFSSGLSVHTFLTRKAVMAIDKDYLKKNGKAAVVIAKNEGLIHHARSIEERIGL